MLDVVRRSSRQAMNRLSELYARPLLQIFHHQHLTNQSFPILKALKLNPGVVDVLAPRELQRELQLESIGFRRQFSAFDELNNLDPDFFALQQAFETGVAFSDMALDGKQDNGTWKPNAKDAMSFSESWVRVPILGEKRKTSSDIAGPTPAEKQRRIGPNTSLPRESEDRVATVTTSTLPPKNNHRAARFQPMRPSNISSQEWKRMRKHHHHQWSLTQKATRSMEMGLNISSDLRKPIQDAIVQPSSEAARLLFSGITTVSYVLHLALAVSDSLGRLFLYRSRLTCKMMEELLPQVNEVVPTFVTAITKPFTNNDMLLNSRGKHWFSIAGHDRNNKSRPAATKFQQQNHDALTKLFMQGSVLQRLTAYGCEILKAHFPAIVKRYQDSINCMKKEYGIDAMFGLFFNFCLNAPREGVRRVFCKPHVDWKNVAFGVWHFNHHEKCWLVIWEAGIAIEILPGVFVFYPSSLFLHFNIDLSDLPVVTTQTSERPTKENSAPLYFCNCDTHEGNQGWADADGRGSMVWFNQASMIQTSELGVPTIQQAKQQGLNTHCDSEAWLAQGIFPSTT
ncbi:hypothetical protein EV368DRAFT_89341 [Lentinula lateritia]|nr:hypothetical protein EV368DRAFT_89341 [Lentinula lateritia]